MKLYHILRVWLAIKIPKLRKKLLTKSEHEKLIMAEFRHLARLFGFKDIDDMTDEEIQEGVTEASKIMASTGMSVDQAGTALRNAFLIAKFPTCSEIC